MIGFALVLFVGLLGWIAFLVWDRASVQEDCDWHIKQLDSVARQLNNARQEIDQLKVRNRSLHDQIANLESSQCDTVEKFDGVVGLLQDSESELRAFCEDLQKKLEELK